MPPPSPTVNTSHISVQHIKDAYLAGGEADAVGHANFSEYNNTQIKMSWFVGAGFTEGADIPGGTPQLPISVHSHHKGRTFGAEDSGSEGGCG